jgi:hypothetical protein
LATGGATKSIIEATATARPNNVAFSSMDMDASFNEFHPTPNAPDSL